MNIFKRWYSIKSMKDDNVFNAIEHDNYSFFSRLHQKCLELLEQIEYDLEGEGVAFDHSPRDLQPPPVPSRGREGKPVAHFACEAAQRLRKDGQTGRHDLKQRSE